MKISTSDIERFNCKVELIPFHSCWEWVASKDAKGYGFFYFFGSMVRAHIFSYNLARGRVPIGLELDHLCRNRSCVNPDHLEAVTHLENVRRKPLVLRCPRGHEYSEENTYINRSRVAANFRVCRICEKARSLRRYAAAKAAICICSIILANCGKSQATMPASAISINGPAGVDCYAILNGEGVAIGGNCLPH